MEYLDKVAWSEHEQAKQYIPFNLDEYIILM